jgi:hypothetical protein
MECVRADSQRGQRSSVLAAPRSSCSEACPPLLWDIPATNQVRIEPRRKSESARKRLQRFRMPRSGPSGRAGCLEGCQPGNRRCSAGRLALSAAGLGRTLTWPYLFRRIARHPAGLHARPAPPRRHPCPNRSERPDLGPGADPAPPPRTPVLLPPQAATAAGPRRALHGRCSRFGTSPGSSVRWNQTHGGARPKPARPSDRRGPPGPSRGRSTAPPRRVTRAHRHRWSERRPPRRARSVEPPAR